MRRIFTDYLRSFDRSGGRVPRALVDRLWRALRAALVAELKKRHLWHSPPEYLGISGYESWRSRGPDGREEALDDLLADCYVFVFVDRAHSLRAQLEVKDNIDGLVFLNIRHFLVERQRRCDPLGFHTFQLLRAAVRESVAAGEIRLLQGDPAVGGDSLLGFGRPRRSETGRQDWSSVACVWANALLPDLITARGPARTRLVEDVRRLLRELAGTGCPPFRLADLAEPLKQEVRARWTALGRQEAGRTAVQVTDDETVELVAVAPPDVPLERRQSFDALAAGVEVEIARSTASRGTKRYLLRLWRFVCSHAAGAPEPAHGASREERLPSRRRLALLLGIPRNRLPELLRTLRRFAASLSERHDAAVTDRGVAIAPISEEGEVDRDR